MHDRNCTGARGRAFTAPATALAVVVLGLMGIAPAGAQNAQPNPEVRVSTNMGSFVIELRPNRAPRTVANFLRYVRTGFYTDTLIHRVVANFVIQGGGHEATPPYALKPTGPPVVNESGNGLENKRGTVGLARGPKPDSGTAQFYINLVDNPELDPLPTRWGYTVFGKVVQGMNVVERIGVVPTGAFGPFKSEAPLTPVVIKSITLLTPSESGASGSGAASPTTPSATGGTSQSPTTPPAGQSNPPGTPTGGAQSATATHNGKGSTTQTTGTSNSTTSTGSAQSSTAAADNGKGSAPKGAGSAGASTSSTSATGGHASGNGASTGGSGETNSQTKPPAPPPTAPPPTRP